MLLEWRDLLPLATCCPAEGAGEARMHSPDLKSQGSSPVLPGTLPRLVRMPVVPGGFQVA